MSKIMTINVPLAERLANARLQHQKQQAALATTTKATRSRSGPRDSRPAPPSTKGPQPLSCIIDDTALLAGLKDGEDLKSWIRSGVVNLYVPLYTLDKLNTLRSGNLPSSTEAPRALEWLDEITTATADKSAGFVQLQGPDDQYTAWQEVEKYLLPETPLSVLGGQDGFEGVNDAFLKNLEARSNQRTTAEVVIHGMNKAAGAKSGTGPTTPSGSEGKRGRAAQAAPTIPARMRPLLNFVVWRTYHFDLSSSSSGTYILLTNEVTTQKLAQKFGVRAKMLNQVRNLIAKGGYKLVQADGGADEKAEQKGGGEDDIIDAVGDMKAADERDEDEVVFVPPKRTSSQDVNKAPVIDPDHFGRASAQIRTEAVNAPVATVAAPVTTPKSSPAPKASHQKQKSQPNSPVQSHRTPNRQHNANQQSRSLSKNVHNSAANTNGNGSLRGLKMGLASGLGRGQAQQLQQQQQQQIQAQQVQVPRLAKPIDPDSYARPPPVGAMRGGRGGRGGVMGRRLWEPSG